MKKITILLLFILLPQISHSSSKPHSEYEQGSLTILFTNQTSRVRYLRLTSTNNLRDRITIPSTFNTKSLKIKPGKTKLHTLSKESLSGYTFFLNDYEIIQQHPTISALLFATLTLDGRIKFHSPQNRIILR